MLDDLRRSALDSELDFDFDDDPAMNRIDANDGRRDQYFLGMRPAERMMLSIFVFMCTVVLVLAFLLATGRMVL